MTTVAQIGEARLLAAIAKIAARPAPGVVVGVGDDAAVLSRIGPEVVLTTDMLIEGIDFERAWAKFGDIGHKAAAVNLSDLAAMGARPRALLLSLALQPSERVRDILTLVAAVQRQARRYGAALVGGDLSRTTGPLVLSVTAVGEVDEGRALPRYRGVPGDVLLVSGSVGAAAAGLLLLRGVAHGDGVSPAARRALVARQLRTTPRVALGCALVASRRAHSCADVSDGLARDTAHVLSAGATFRLELAALPVARGVAAIAQEVGRPAWELALGGGEDFELVLACAPRHVRALQALARAVGTRLTPVGEIVAGRTPVLVDARGARATDLPAGFDHFVSQS